MVRDICTRVYYDLTFKKKGIGAQKQSRDNKSHRGWYIEIV